MDILIVVDVTTNSLYLTYDVVGRPFLKKNVKHSLTVMITHLYKHSEITKCTDISLDYFNLTLILIKFVL